MKKTLTLLELNSLVKEVVELSLPNEYWVEAELSEAREVRGHCYMQLIQKDERSNTPVAQAPAKCWKSSWMLILPHFERVTGQRLRAGLKVLLKVYAQFHENYGFSWIVTDIDPTYTMGDMARRRQEIIRALKAQGIFDLNRELPLPQFAQRIAVISSEQAAGYGDFVNQLVRNKYGFQFDIEFFPAIMQGEQVEPTVIAALNEIYLTTANLRQGLPLSGGKATGRRAVLGNWKGGSFDCVVIIRGGGAVADLSGFDTLALAENVANFPIPVITGIGHDRDESVLDMVAHTAVKTPTAAADILIDNLKHTNDRISDARERIINTTNRILQMQHLRLSRLTQAIPALFTLATTQQTARLNRLTDRMTTAAGQLTTERRHRLDILEQTLLPIVNSKLMQQRHRLQLITQRIEAVNPERLLARGYSITLHKGKVLSSTSHIQPGDTIQTRLQQGRFSAVVTSLSAKEEEQQPPSVQ